jgi:hypothetical protein
MRENVILRVALRRVNLSGVRRDVRGLGVPDAADREQEGLAAPAGYFVATSFSTV